jgi:hypothetical protein
MFIKLLLEWKTESQIHASGSGPQNNTQARNKALTTMGYYMLFGFLSLLAPCPHLARRLLQVELTMYYFFASECFFQLIIAIVCPLVFYLSSEDMIHYFKREFWDNAPDCLQIYNPDTVFIINIQALPSQPEPVQASPSQPEPAQACPSQPKAA